MSETDQRPAPTLATLSLVIETERAIAALDPPPHHAALVALARAYAAAAGVDDPGMLAVFGPKLTLVMTKLGAVARARTAPAEPVATQAPTEQAPTAVDEIRARRERRAADRRAG